MGLPSSNWDTVQALLADRSDPRSPRYAQWLPMPEVAALTAADPGVRAEVRGWLEAGGAACADWNSALRCAAPVAAVEALFATELHAFAHVDPRTGAPRRGAPLGGGGGGRRRPRRRPRCCTASPWTRT